MKKLIALFGLLIFVTASVAPAIASVADVQIAVVDFEKDPKKVDKKAEKNTSGDEKAKAAEGCETKTASGCETKTASGCETKSASGCETANKAECGEKKESKSVAVAEKK